VVVARFLRAAAQEVEAASNELADEASDEVVAVVSTAAVVELLADTPNLARARAMRATMRGQSTSAAAIAAWPNARRGVAADRPGARHLVTASTSTDPRRLRPEWARGLDRPANLLADLHGPSGRPTADAQAEALALAAYARTAPGGVPRSIARRRGNDVLGEVNDLVRSAAARMLLGSSGSLAAPDAAVAAAPAPRRRHAGRARPARGEGPSAPGGGTALGRAHRPSSSISSLIDAQAGLLRRERAAEAARAAARAGGARGASAAAVAARAAEEARWRRDLVLQEAAKAAAWCARIAYDEHDHES
jgi:hypothetical protein